MSRGARNILIVAGVVFVLALIFYSLFIGTYNKLVAMDENIKASWAQVENQLQRRYDLIPNLVETVKGYASHEKHVFLDVTKARSQVGKAGNISEKIEANNELTTALSRLLLVVENYPELKANQNFIRLQDELAGTENRISVERRRYNEAVRAYNVKTRSFPTNILAGMYGFEKAAFFEVPEAAKAAPRVKFD